MNIINVIGLGYIGLPTSLILAAHGNKVIGSDIDIKKVELLNSQKLTFVEKDMKDLFNKAMENGIIFQSQPQNSDVYIVTVPTPYLKDTKNTNMSYVKNAVRSILEVNTKEAILIIESTVSPGAIDEHIRPMLENYPNISLVHAPERILPGSMVEELIYNSRTIGADDEKIGKKVASLYETFCQGEIILTDIKTAEMSKVIENTYRDVNIAFANEVAQICSKAGLDVYEVIEIANKHPRVNILSPGPGVGGHCIPIDPWFLVGSYPEEVNIILKARKINEGIPQKVLMKIEQIVNEENIKWSEVGIYGLSYKENVDDVRHSPTMQIMELLKGEQKKIKFFDHKASCEFSNEFNFVDSWSKFSKGIKLLVIMVYHEELKKENLKQFDIILDTKDDLNGMDLNKRINLWGYEE